MMKRTLPVLLFAAVGLAACKDGTGSDSRLVRLVVEPSTWYLAVGDTVRLAAVGTQADSEEVAVNASYTSTNNAVATVTADGKVTAVALGTADVIAKASGRADTAHINVISGSNLRTFNVDATSETGCDEGKYHAARLVASTAHTLLYEDLQNPPSGFTSADYQSMADEFEAVGYQSDVANFGTPTDRDGNGKVIGLFTRAVNELTPASVTYIFGGFFYGRDLFARTPQSGFEACPTSNQAEMFYLLAADPQGSINGNVRSNNYIRNTTLSTLAHEMQHLINYGRRLYVNKNPHDETVWLDEGLAHVGEELAYYAKTGYAPGQNLAQPQTLGTTTQFNNYAEYQGNNLSRLRTYLRAPESNSPIANNDELETRGATWWFLRYAADRKGGNQAAFWSALVNNPTATGIANLQAALGADPVAYLRDWTVATYTDDAVATASFYQNPSWNHRSIFSDPRVSGSYPLQVRTLAAGSSTVSVMSGSAAYLKFGVAPAQQADVRFVQAGGSVGSCTPTTLTVGQVAQVAMNTGIGFCLGGGATGAEYVAIPFYGSTAPGTTIQVGVSATGVIAPVGPPVPVVSPSAGLLFPLDGEPLSGGDGGLEMRIRLRERRLAARLRTGLPSVRADLASVEGPTAVVISVVRTK